MQANNKILTAKQKKILKREKAKLRRKTVQLNTFSFQNQMVDLVSDSHDQPVQAIQEEQAQSSRPVVIEENVQTADLRNLQVGEAEYLLVVEVDKFYRVKMESDKKNTQISVIADDDIVVNGRVYKNFETSSTFIMCVNREQGKHAKFQQFSGRLSKEARQKVTKSMVNLKTETLIKANCHLQIELTSQPWEHLPECVDNNQSLFLVGIKNSGKSTFADYLLNIKRNQCAVLDCDIGRNSCLEGCVSLCWGAEAKKIWIGELTPLNNLQTYLRAIRFLFQYYKEHLFTKKLVINTMGYLTGLGEFLLYEIYHIVKPQAVLFLRTRGDNYHVDNITTQLKSGSYVGKLYVSRSSLQPPSSTSFYQYENVHCVNKKGFSRFQKMFESKEQRVNNIVQLLEAIRKSDLICNKTPHFKKKDRQKIAIYEQSRHGKEDLDGQEVVSYRKLSQDQIVDMRIVVLGRMIEKGASEESKEEETSSLFQVSGLGFGFQGKVYFKGECEGTTGIVNEGMDFQKGFYHLNEKQLIDLQLRTGRLPFTMVTTKGLGSKGTRNNPSKMT